MTDNRALAHQIIDRTYDFIAEISRIADVHASVSDIAIQITIGGLSAAAQVEGDVKTFLSEETSSARGDALPLADLYQHYSDWCIENGYDWKGYDTFKTDCKAAGLSITENPEEWLALNIALKQAVTP